MFDTMHKYKQSCVTRVSYIVVKQQVDDTITAALTTLHTMYKYKQSFVTRDTCGVVKQQVDDTITAGTAALTTFLTLISAPISIKCSIMFKHNILEATIRAVHPHCKNTML
eukprot:GHVR01150213.1.p1 GENE.GHVR01150213.1~~GHVR01150213.1.p1  ORF type:complete len:111 (-),score=13.78 GHVR01150213.1:227-559(-)